ncbi:hypothetical protein FRC01_005045 [Tulasnella sp. 417]|nr:hypothetical protein FRC01_005045 [Tulasnella sp. 417]
MNYPQVEPKLKDVPNIPDKFGEDGGHLYRYYDALADELDEDMVKSLKSQLDGILIFAGLFAGVNSAFLGLTLPEMSADPADDTNALLLQLVTGGNGTIQSAADLPSATFPPPPNIFPINVLFSLSLTLAIVASFLAVLGEQWLVYYRKRSGGGVEVQRWEQLRRYLGAKRWRLELILDDILPALLLLALIVFSVAFVLYLKTLNKTIYYVITAALVMALAILFVMAIVASLDHWCPFKSPLSRLLKLILEGVGKNKSLQAATVSVASLIIVTIRLIRNAKTFILCWQWDRSQRRTGSLSLRDGIRKTTFEGVNNAINSVIDGCPRPGEETTQLQAVAIKRMLCTSKDFNALIYTGINLLAMSERESACYLLEDDSVHSRLGELIKNPEEMLVSVFSCAFTYLLLGGQSYELLIEPNDRLPHSLAASTSTSARPLGITIVPLKKGVHGSWPSLDTSKNSRGGLLFYLEFLHLIFHDLEGLHRIGPQLIFKLPDHIFDKGGDSESWTPLCIWLAASSVSMLNQGDDPASDFSLFLPRGRKVQLTEGMTARQRRVDSVKALISEVGWGMWSFPESNAQDGDWEDMLGAIKGAFSTYTSQSKRIRGREDVWLLEQAFYISMEKPAHGNLDFISKSCIDLLCTFAIRGVTSFSAAQNEDTTRCIKLLSECIEAMQKKDKGKMWNSLSKSLGELAKCLNSKSNLNGVDKKSDETDNPVLQLWLQIQERLPGTPKSESEPDSSQLLAGLSDFVLAEAAFGAIEAVGQAFDRNPANPISPATTVEPRQRELENKDTKGSSPLPSKSRIVQSPPADTDRSQGGKKCGGEAKLRQ